MAIYHLNVKTGSRIGGQSALAKADYIEKEGKYAKDAEDVAYRESGNMPEWAEDDPRQYWAGADEHERANGRLFVQVEFALPRELDERQQREVASSFAADLTGPERLPYTMAIHRGGGDNPHVHLMISERGMDGHDRSAETWFKRANTKDPENGGAKKTAVLSSREWLEDTRERWADRANDALERAGSRERITDASLKDQYFDAAERGDERAASRLNREPGVHMGPHNVARAMRGEDVDRVADAGDAADRNRVRWIDGALERLDEQICELTQQIAQRVQQAWNRGYDSGRGRW